MRDIKSFFHYSWNFGRNYVLQGLSPYMPLVVPKPLYVSLDVGPICNLRCKQCDFWKIKTMPKDKLTLTQVKRVLTKLRAWLGPFRLVFTGAEPFIHRDILDIVRSASELGLYTVMVTNGQTVGRDKAKAIVESGLTVLNVSLDGMDAKTHDYLRGVRGAYQRATQALEFVHQEKQQAMTGPTLYVNTVVMKRNLDQLPDLAKWVSARGYDGIHFQALESKHLFGGREKYDPQWFAADPLWPSDHSQVVKIMERLQAIARDYPIKNSHKELDDYKAYFKNPLEYAKRYKFCYTGVNNFSITVNGDVRLCFAMKAVGNVLKQDPRQIWSGIQAQRLRHTIRKCDRACRVLPCNKRHELGQVTSAFSRNLTSLLKRRVVG